MRGDETPGRIVTNFCIGVEVHDVITCADLYYDRLRSFGVAGGGQILAFSIDLLRRPYNTLALPCECVIMQISACNYVSLFSPFRDISKISVLPSCYPPKSRLKPSQGVFYYDPWYTIWWPKTGVPG